ncbi:MAG: PQQ-binding-like beta-propeller repeat protein, partial [Gemmatimonadales bacterium]
RGGRMETYRPLGPSVLALLLALSGTVESHAAGAQRRFGEGSADEGAPAAANLGFEIVWKRSLGSGYSGITVADGRVITMYSDGRFDTLVALDAAKGAELWRYRFAPTYRGHDGSVDGPLSTPTVDESLVYGLGPRGHLFAVRLADGQEQWSKNIVEAIGARPPFWGIATRPVVEGRVLIVQTGGIGGRSITGFDKRTGDILWSVGDDRVGYQSPGTMTLAGRRQVVTVSNRQIMGIVPQTGEILWSHQYNTDDLDGSSQPLPMGQDRFLLTPSPFEYRTEALLFQVQETENGLAAEEVWRAPALSKSYAVPILHQDYLYGLNRSFLTCVRWNQR